MRTLAARARAPFFGDLAHSPMAPCAPPSTFPENEMFELLEGCVTLVVMLLWMAGAVRLADRIG